MAQDETTTKGKQEAVRFRLDEASVLHAVKNIDKGSYAEHGNNEITIWTARLVESCIFNCVFAASCTLVRCHDVLLVW